MLYYHRINFCNWGIGQCCSVYWGKKLDYWINISVANLMQKSFCLPRLWIVGGWNGNAGYGKVIDFFLSFWGDPRGLSRLWKKYIFFFIDHDERMWSENIWYFLTILLILAYPMLQLCYYGGPGKIDSFILKEIRKHS